jgi:two-component system, OmpR family, sensor histidine kinase KdpD
MLARFRWSGWRAGGLKLRRSDLMREPQMSAQSRFAGLVGTWKGYLFGLALVGAATAIAFGVKDLFAESNLVMLYFLCVGVTGIFWGYGPSIVVSVVSVLAFDIFFVPPVLSLTVADTQYVLTFLVMLLVGLVTSYLMQRVKKEAEGASRRERETAALYSLGRDLAVSNSLESYVGAIVGKAKETFERDALIYLPDKNNPESMRVLGGQDQTRVDSADMAAALWSFQHQKPAGRGTDTLPDASSRFVPLGTARGPVGVIALSGGEASNRFDAGQLALLDAFADLAAVAVEGIQRTEEANQARILGQALKDTERLQTALLNSVSHDLRTPLVSIIGALSSLQETGMTLTDTAKSSMIQVASDEAERLNRLITNLLDVSRIEAGALRVNKQPCDIQELIGAAVAQLGGRIGKRNFSINVPEGLPIIVADSSLLVQAIVNLLDNAIKYSPPDSSVDINARVEADSIIVEIADRGEGIPPRDLDRIFEKFYRAQGVDKASGTGLGLSITRGIVEAHGGQVSAQNRLGGGMVFKIELPIQQTSYQERTGG